jgi:hypothetical protein
MFVHCQFDEEFDQFYDELMENPQKKDEITEFNVEDDDLRCSTISASKLHQVLQLLSNSKSLRWLGFNTINGVDEDEEVIEGGMGFNDVLKVLTRETYPAMKAFVVIHCCFERDTLVEFFTKHQQIEEFISHNNGFLNEKVLLQVSRAIPHLKKFTVTEMNVREEATLFFKALSNWKDLEYLIMDSQYWGFNGTIEHEDLFLNYLRVAGSKLQILKSISCQFIGPRTLAALPELCPNLTSVAIKITGTITPNDITNLTSRLPHLTYVGIVSTLSEADKEVAKQALQASNAGLEVEIL